MKHSGDAGACADAVQIIQGVDMCTKWVEKQSGEELQDYGRRRMVVESRRHRRPTATVMPKIRQSYGIPWTKLPLKSRPPQKAAWKLQFPIRFAHGLSA